MKKSFILRSIITVITVSLLAGHVHAAEPALKKARGYKKDLQTRIIKKIALPKGYHEGLFYDERYLWVANGKGIGTWIIDPDNGSIVSRIEPVGTFTEGIAEADKGFLWVTDWDEKKLYRVTINREKMVSENEVSLDPSRPTGITRIGDSAYLITWTRGLGTKYHLLEVNDEGRVLRKMRIKNIHEPAHLAWDGEHIWITSWYSQRVYKIDLDTFTMLGDFKSPAPKTTGIAWDGEYLWVTGTYDGLYQVEVIDTTE